MEDVKLAGEKSDALISPCASPPRRSDRRLDPEQMLIIILAHKSDPRLPAADASL